MEARGEHKDGFRDGKVCGSNNCAYMANLSFACLASVEVELGSTQLTFRVVGLRARRNVTRCLAALDHRHMTCLM